MSTVSAPRAAIKAHVVSDLHVDFWSSDDDDWKSEWNVPDADLLLLPGDLSNNRRRSLKWINRYAQRHPSRPIVLVLGNHDYYNSRHDTVYEDDNSEDADMGSDPWSDVDTDDDRDADTDNDSDNKNEANATNANDAHEDEEVGMKKMGNEPMSAFQSGGKVTGCCAQDEKKDIITNSGNNTEPETDPGVFAYIHCDSKNQNSEPTAAPSTTTTAAVATTTAINDEINSASALPPPPLLLPSHSSSLTQQQQQPSTQTLESAIASLAIGDAGNMVTVNKKKDNGGDADDSDNCLICFEDVVAWWKQQAKTIPELVVLECDEVTLVIKNTRLRILGCTLWSDMNHQVREMRCVGRDMADYVYCYTRLPILGNRGLIEETDSEDSDGDTVGASVMASQSSQSSPSSFVASASPSSALHVRVKDMVFWKRVRYDFHGKYAGILDPETWAKMNLSTVVSQKHDDGHGKNNGNDDDFNLRRLLPMDTYTVHVRSVAYLLSKSSSAMLLPSDASKTTACPVLVPMSSITVPSLAIETDISSVAGPVAHSDATISSSSSSSSLCLTSNCSAASSLVGGISLSVSSAAAATAVITDALDTRFVVMTHHLPSYRSISSYYVGGRLNSGFASHLDRIVKQIGADVWIHGHSHARQDYMIGRTRIICNPRGYPFEVRDFDPNFVVLI